MRGSSAFLRPLLLAVAAVAQSPAGLVHAPLQQAPDEFRALFATTKGSFVLAIVRSWSPLGADRLWTLLNEGHYNGCRLSRVVPGFVVQFGLSADPAENRRWAMRSLPDEPRQQDNRLGRVAFATSGPNSRSTQLYINLGDNRWLDGLSNEYLTPLGTVEDGMPVLTSLYAGYGETVDQAQLAAGGEAFAAKSFPMLDRVLMAFPVQHGHHTQPIEMLERTRAQHHSLVLPSDLLVAELARRSAEQPPRQQPRRPKPQKHTGRRAGERARSHTSGEAARGADAQPRPQPAKAVASGGHREVGSAAAVGQPSVSAERRAERGVPAWQPPQQRPPALVESGSAAPSAAQAPQRGGEEGGATSARPRAKGWRAALEHAMGPGRTLAMPAMAMHPSVGPMT